MMSRTLQRRLDRLAERVSAAHPCPACRPDGLLLFVPDEAGLEDLPDFCVCGRDLRICRQVVVGVSEDEVCGPAMAMA